MGPISVSCFMPIGVEGCSISTANLISALDDKGMFRESFNKLFLEESKYHDIYCANYQKIGSYYDYLWKRVQKNQDGYPIENTPISCICFRVKCKTEEEKNSLMSFFYYGVFKKLESYLLSNIKPIKEGYYLNPLSPSEEEKGILYDITFVLYFAFVAHTLDRELAKKEVEEWHTYSICGDNVKRSREEYIINKNNIWKTHYMQLRVDKYGKALPYSDMTTQCDTIGALSEMYLCERCNYLKPPLYRFLSLVSHLIFPQILKEYGITIIKNIYYCSETGIKMEDIIDPFTNKLQKYYVIY